MVGGALGVVSKLMADQSATDRCAARLGGSVPVLIATDLTRAVSLEVRVWRGPGSALLVGTLGWRSLSRVGWHGMGRGDLHRRCSRNPGPGGWGAVLRHGTHEKELHGGERETISNRMELMAVIRRWKA